MLAGSSSPPPTVITTEANGDLEISPMPSSDKDPHYPYLSKGPRRGAALLSASGCHKAESLPSLMDWCQREPAGTESKQDPHTYNNNSV